MKKIIQRVRIVIMLLLITTVTTRTVFGSNPGPTVPDNTKAPLNFWAQNYAAQWISQSGSIALPSDEYYDVNPGDQVTVTAFFRNQGTKSWVSTENDRQVCIAIYKDPAVMSAPLALGYDVPGNINYGRSYFYDSSWASIYRIGCVQEVEVEPGEIGTFVLNFKIPADAPSGKYREDISMASGPYWIANPTNGDPLGVAHIWVGFDIHSTLPALNPVTSQVYGQTTIPVGDLAGLLVECPADSIVVGGGFSADQDLVVYTQSKIGNGWEVYAKNNAVIEELLTVYAVCLSNTTAVVNQYMQQIMVLSGDVGQAVALCPAGSIATGGGFASNPDTLWVYNNTMAGSGDRWEVFAQNTGSISQLLNAYVLCLSGMSATTTREMNTASVAGNATGGGEATCPIGTVLTDGGYSLGSNLVLFHTSMETAEPNKWNVYARNASASNQSMNIFSVCLWY